MTFSQLVKALTIVCYHPPTHTHVHVVVATRADSPTHLDEDVGDEEHAGVHIHVHAPEPCPPRLLGDPAPLGVGIRSVSGLLDRSTHYISASLPNKIPLGKTYRRPPDQPITTTHHRSASPFMGVTASRTTAVFRTAYPTMLLFGCQQGG